jgi:hypothetical protein
MTVSAADQVIRNCVQCRSNQVSQGIQREAKSEICFLLRSTKLYWPTTQERSARLPTRSWRSRQKVTSGLLSLYGTALKARFR